MKNLISTIINFRRLVFGKYPKLYLKCDYNKYWKSKKGKELERLNLFQKDRLTFLERKVKEGLSIKDIGSGDGAILIPLNKVKKFSKVLVYDISTDSLKHLRKFNFIDKEINLDEIEKVKKIEKTDYTLALEILEHLKQSEEVLLSLLDTTKKTLIFSVPNTGYLAHRFRLLFGSFPHQWRLSPSEHLRYWTYRDMKWWLKELNIYDLSNIYVYQGFPILNKIWPSLFGAGLIVEVNKKKK